MIYFPFGAGPRSCIGNHFALQELMIMVILFYRHYQFRLQPGFTVEPDPLITLRPKHGMVMTLRSRRTVSRPSAGKGDCCAAATEPTAPMPGATAPNIPTRRGMPSE